MRLRHWFSGGLSSLVKLLFGEVFGVLVKLLSPVLIIRVAPIKTASFGNFLLEPELRILEALADSVDGRETRRLDLFFASDLIGGKKNRALRDLWKKQVNLVDSRLATMVLYRCWTYWSQATRFAKHVNRSGCRCRDERNLFDRYPSQLKLRPEHFQDVVDVLEDLGTFRDQPIALLHVRDNSYDLARFGSTSDNYRNSDPRQFQMTVDELNNRGFAVVAIGNEGTVPIPLSGVIDYSNSPQRSDLRDVTIGAIASLYVGSEAAPSNLAKVFRRPQLIANNTRIAELGTSTRLQMHIMKTHLLGGRVLTQSEVWKRGLADYQTDSDVMRFGLELVENSADEIHAALLDLFSVLDSSQRYREVSPNSLQQQFWSVFKSGITSSPDFKARHGDLRALIAPSFLRKHEEWIQ